MTACLLSGRLPSRPAASGSGRRSATASGQPGARMSPAVFVVHATRKLLTRVGKPSPEPERSRTVLGDWYATVLFWRPQVALFVNESTLLPVLMPLAPAAALTERFPPALATLLAAHRVSRRFIDAELLRWPAAGWRPRATGALSGS
jgi:hypothetical protein